MIRSKLFAVVAMLFCWVAGAADNLQLEDEYCRYALYSSTKTASVIKYIGKTSTKTVTIPDVIMCPDDGKTYKVTKIEAAAFYKCNPVTINFPSTLKEIGNSAFEDCPRLFKGKKLSLPPSVTTIGMDAFSNGLFTSLDIPSSVKTIGEGAFQGSKIVSVTFATPSNGLTIGDFAFKGCTALKSVALPNKLTKVGQAAFSGCTALTSATVPGTLKTIPSLCFEDCKALTSFTIPSGVTKIGWGAFSDAGIKSISIASTVTKIEQQAFERSALTSVTIPASVTSVPWCAFNACDYLAVVNLPATLKTIESGAFFNCPALMTIRCDAVTPPDVSDEASFTADSYNGATLILPAQSITAYSKAEVWKKFKWFQRSGIDPVETDTPCDATVEYFNLDGVAVPADNLTPGIYIRRCAGRCAKILVH